MHVSDIADAELVGIIIRVALIASLVGGGGGRGGKGPELPS